MTFRLGLTGSIGMGKSTTVAMFAAAGLAVWDADAAVHKLYGVDGQAVKPIAQLVPDALVNGNVSREALRLAIANNPNLLGQIEAIVHPLVAADRAEFLKNTTTDIVVLDIPLLFEKSSQHEFDATLLVTAPSELQRARVLARPGMTEAHFQAMLARQMPDLDKRHLATHIVETLSIASTEAYVAALITYLRGRNARDRS